MLVLVFDGRDVVRDRLMQRVGGDGREWELGISIGQHRRVVMMVKAAVNGQILLVLAVLKTRKRS